MTIGKKLLINLTLFSLSFSFLLADDTPYRFLLSNASARSAAMGGVFEAISNDASALFYNPATINTVKEKKFSLTFLKNILDINSGNVSYIHRFENSGLFAASVIYTNYGSFNSADKYGNQNGTFGANDLALAVSYGNELDTNLYYGLSIKYIFENLEKYSSSGLALDAGIYYKLKDGRTNIGASILNAGFQLSKFNGQSESIPLDVRLGVNHRLKGLPILVGLSLHHLADKSDNFFDKLGNISIGAELYLGQYVMIRLGYDNQIRKQTTPSSDRKLAGISGGLGIKTNFINFDYGIAQVGSAAPLHRFSLFFDL